MRFRATCYRAHDPRWSFQPLSGDGAAIHGGRVNPKGVPALYLSLSIGTAIREANQGFAFKIDPCVLCSYDVDCEGVVDLRIGADRRAQSVTLDALACAWFADAKEGRVPPSWQLARALIGRGTAGLIVPSFAPGATPLDQNLVLWRWGSGPPYQVTVFDPSGRLPKNQLSWDSPRSRTHKAGRFQTSGFRGARESLHPPQPMRDLDERIRMEDAERR